MNHAPKLKPAVTIIAAGALAAGAGIATATPTHHAREARAREIRLIEVQRKSTQLDLGATGFSPGDRQTITSDLFTPSGHKAGRLDDDCTITQAGKRPEAVCTFVITLGGGQLTGAFAQNLAASDSGKRQAITGGTGRFAGARGELRAGREGKRTPFVIVLR
jgi:hypothetical protein